MLLLLDLLLRFPLLRSQFDSLLTFFLSLLLLGLALSLLSYFKRFFSFAFGPLRCRFRCCCSLLSHLLVVLLDFAQGELHSFKRIAKHLHQFEVCLVIDDQYFDEVLLVVEIQLKRTELRLVQEVTFAHVLVRGLALSLWSPLFLTRKRLGRLENLLLLMARSLLFNSLRHSRLATTRCSFLWTRATLHRSRQATAERFGDRGGVFGNSALLDSKRW